MRPLLLLSASLLAFGCKPAPQVARYKVEPEAAPAAEPKRNWDAVVAEVARIRAMRPLPDDKRARMLQLQDELMAASNSDPAAREAWANLSRIINNR